MAKLPGISVFGATLQSELRPKKSVRPGAIWITTDQGRITQVISNLITNSCKSSPPSISISVQIGRQGDQVVISVEDEGFGISPKDMAEIYAPFFRSDRKVIRNEVGTGLGLVISKTLVELHGGEIKASSTVDVGTRMQVILPGASDAPMALMEKSRRARSWRTSAGVTVGSAPGRA